MAKRLSATNTIFINGSAPPAFPLNVVQFRQGISNIAPGLADHQRVGRNCNLLTLDLQGTTQWIVGEPAVGVSFIAPTIIYFYVILDLQPNGTAGGVTYNDVWEDSNDGVTSAWEPEAWPNRTNLDRFVFLDTWEQELKMEAVWTKSSAATYETSTIRKRIKRHIELGCMATYQGTTSEPTTNEILIAMKFRGADDDQQLTIVLASLLTFEDSRAQSREMRMIP